MRIGNLDGRKVLVEGTAISNRQSVQQRIGQLDENITRQQAAKQQITATDLENQQRRQLQLQIAELQNQLNNLDGNLLLTRFNAQVDSQVEALQRSKADLEAVVDTLDD